ncbi:MAG: hypothetical protein JKY31_02065 [Rhodobacteraceae bacterium]|nr:hypothetical protein [Paracoccaceae bacterium]
MKKIFALTLVSLALAGCLETTSTGQRGYLPDGTHLSPDDQIIWAGLTEAQRAAALPYLQNGGTLVSSLGAY